MNTIGIRELKQNASEVIKRVCAGEWLVVTDRGRPVAQISPINSSTLGRMIDAGQVTLATHDVSSLPAPLKSTDGVSLSQMIIDERHGEE